MFYSKPLFSYTFQFPKLGSSQSGDLCQNLLAILFSLCEWSHWLHHSTSSFVHLFIIVHHSWSHHIFDRFFCTSVHLTDELTAHSLRDYFFYFFPTPEHSRTFLNIAVLFNSSTFCCRGYSRWNILKGSVLSNIRTPNCSVSL